MRKITTRQEERRRRFERGELPANTPAPSEPEADLPIPTDLPPPKTLAERLGGPA